MDDFIRGQGLPYLAHLFRRLADTFIQDVARWYEELGVEAPPRTHSTMLALKLKGPLGITELAALLRQSHPLVITWVRQLKALGFVETRSVPGDARRTEVVLTASGEAEMEKYRDVDLAVGRAFASLMREANAQVVDPLWRIENACRERSFLERLREQSPNPIQRADDS